MKASSNTNYPITQKIKDKKEIINKTFKSKLTFEQIDKLYTALKENNYIPSRTSLEAFRMIFNSEPIKNIEEPLNWLKTNRDLAYLFNKLFSKELIENRNFASVIEYYKFVNSNNKKLTAGDIRTALSDIKKNGNPKEADNIDKIINCILSDKIQIKQGFMKNINEKIEDRLAEIELLLKNQKDVLTFNETAKYIGLSKSYLYKLTSSKKIPHFSPGGKLLYFSKNEIDKWLLSRPVTTSDEIEQKAANFVKKERQSNYNSINKIKDIKLNYTIIKSKKLLMLQYAFLGIHKAGGKLKALNSIKEAQKQGILNKKQAYDLRTKIKQICNIALR